MTFHLDPFLRACAANPSEALRQLGREWMSLGSEPFEGHRLEDGVPAILRWLHREELAVAHQNGWVSPEELAAEDGRLVFYVENQGVCVWATDPAEANGPVWIRSSEETEWHEEAPALDTFLVEACVFEGLVGAPWGGLASWCDRRTTGKLRERLSRLPFRTSRWLGELFGADDVLVNLMPNEDGETVWAGALTEEAEDSLRELGLELD